MNLDKQIKSMKDLLWSEGQYRESFLHFPLGGDSSLDVIFLWEGIVLWANEIHLPKLSYPTNVFDDSDEFLLINICHAGRCEVELIPGSFIYMSPGILDISACTPRSDYCYPGSLYSGIEICFNMRLLKDRMPEALASYGFSYEVLERYFRQGNLLAMLSGAGIQEEEHLFQMIRGKKSSLASIRFAFLSLLVHLADGGCTRIDYGTMVSKGQRRIVAEAEQLLISDLHKRYTIEEIADLFGISPSALQKYFQAVYGRSIFQYMREKRVKRAMELLAETEENIGKIALACGYEHQGKFGKVFKDFTGVSPMEYRRLNKRTGVKGP